MPTQQSDERTRWPPKFRDSLRLPIAFVVAFALWVALSNLSFNWLVGSDPSRVVDALWNIPSGLVQLGLVLLLVLRFEGVRLRNLGLGRRQVVPALVAVSGFLVVVNVIVAGLILLDGGQLSLGSFALYRSPPFDYSVSALAATGVVQYVFVGPIEELAFRGYLQNKVRNLLGRGSAPLQTVVAIVTTAIVFSVLHVPTIVLVEGTPIDQAVGSLILLTLSGITYGYGVGRVTVPVRVRSSVPPIRVRHTQPFTRD